MLRTAASACKHYTSVLREISQRDPARVVGVSNPPCPSCSNTVSSSLLKAACITTQTRGTTWITASSAAAVAVPQTSMPAKADSIRFKSPASGKPSVRYGSMEVLLDDFKPFFSNFANVQSVYKPKAGAKYVEGHAVVLVGYNNEQQYWVAKNSWGDGWADNGFFKVAFGVCSILTSGSGEAYSIVWEPSVTSHRATLNLTPGPRAGCYWYKAHGGDYMSRVALLAGIPLEKFMTDNVQYVKDLDAPLDGIKLLLCNPKQGRSAAMPRSAPTAAGSRSTSDPQLESLMRIKSLIDKADHLKTWTRELGVNFGYCTDQHFLGVNCDDNNLVNEINLSNDTIAGLQGTLPPASAFSGLAKMTKLTIADQPGISGTLPSDWSQLKLLEFIDVGNNSLVGTLPAPWGSLSKLKVLGMVGNKLTGQIPSAYKGLTSLQDVGMSRNQLTGTIPAFLGNFHSLKNWWMHSNKLTGELPDSLASIASLQGVVLTSNSLSGTIPAFLGTLHSLKLLELGDNMFIGQLPNSLKDLTVLEILAVGDNALTGTIPASLGALHNLRKLYLENNKFVGTIPTSLSSMTSLKEAEFSGNIALGGCLPKSWSGKLEVQNVSGTRITGFC